MSRIHCSIAIVTVSLTHTCGVTDWQQQTLTKFCLCDLSAEITAVPLQLDSTRAVPAQLWPTQSGPGVLKTPVQNVSSAT